ncbi:hypothetical protein Acr_19g0009680 [Actinidia rufa]|uniref:Auxin-responsive protein n=1 Tax=Actinidia rufa TaxID=165716 RepID=A0A7J0GB99_9ERIC|nr:hypothetical protein Acr_19g0009680 [Actinidia rufa]
MPSGLALNLLNSNRKDPVHGSDVPYQARDNRYYGGFNEYSLLSGQKAEQQQGNWSRPPPLRSYLQTSPHSRDLSSQPALVEQHEAAKGNCKIFGIQLASNPVGAESEQRESIKVSDHTLPNSEQENPSPTSQPPITDCQGKVQGGSTRSCTKVHKQGIALGRSVDLTKFNGYEELIDELDQLFEFNGELKAQNKNWEFCGIVRKISIYTREEVQRMNPGTVTSKCEENSLVGEGTDDKEVKNSTLPLVSNPDKC